MATLATGGADERRSVNHEPPLIPMIDLLLCCIMFLLVTAVWNRLASVDADLEAPGRAGAIDAPPPPSLLVHVRADGFAVVGDVGDETRIARAADRTLDADGLQEHLRARRQLAPSTRRVVVAGDDGVAYAEVVQTIDVVTGTGYHDVTIAGPR